MDNASKRILVVEDDEFLRDFYKELLTGEHYNVDVAEDGEIAANKIHEGGYDLVLLDIMLPKKDGIQILTELKTNPSQHLNKSIVMLTNLGQDTVIKQCFDLGANGFLIKSALNPDQVLVEIGNYLKAAA
jgi:CheY-like chemotaxis protein